MKKLIPNEIKYKAQGHTSLAGLRFRIQIKESGFSLCLEPLEHLPIWPPDMMWAHNLESVKNFAQRMILWIPHWIIYDADLYLLQPLLFCGSGFTEILCSFCDVSTAPFIHAPAPGACSCYTSLSTCRPCFPSSWLCWGFLSTQQLEEMCHSFLFLPLQPYTVMVGANDFEARILCNSLEIF